MPTLLHIDSSPMGETSVTRTLTQQFVREWRNVHPGGRILSRDLAAIDIPLVDARWVFANFTPKALRTPEQQEVLRLSTEFTTELLTADEYVIGVPMHNWGPTAGFKLWVDQIVRFGETVLVTSAGPKGLLGKKRATFILAAGAKYRPGSGYASMNYLEVWLRTLFSYLGIKDMQFIFADGAAALRDGKVDRSAFLAPHIEAIQELFLQPVNP